MKLRCFAITVFMLTAISAVSAQDICQFLGEWTWDAETMTINQSEDNRLTCSIRSGEKTRIADRVTLANGRVYIEYMVYDTIVCHDTTMHSVLMTCELSNKGLDVQCKKRILTKSPIGCRINPIGDTKYTFVKTKSYPCLKSEDLDESPLVLDSSTNAFMYYDRAESALNDTLFSDAIKVNLCKLYYNQAIRTSELEKQSMTELDYNFIVGQSYYMLASLDNDETRKMEYFRKSLLYLSNISVLNDKFTYARLWSIGNTPIDSSFALFAYYSDIINNCSRDIVLSSVDSVNLVFSLIGRAALFVNYIEDSINGIEDLERAVGIESQYYSPENIDSLCNVSIAHIYALLGQNSEQEETPLPPKGIARKYYQMSIEHYNKAHVKQITEKDVLTLWPIVYAKARIAENYDVDSSFKEFFDTFAVYCYNHPEIHSYQNKALAQMTMSALLARESYDSLFIFYDRIKNGFSLDISVTADYLIGLLNAGYDVNNVREMNTLLHARGAHGKAQSSRVKIAMGDLSGAFDDLFGNEIIFDSILGDTTLNLGHFFIVFMAGKKLGYQKAIQLCDNFIQRKIKDISTIKTFRGIYLLKRANQAETERSLSNEKIARLRNAAKADFRDVIEYEFSREEVKSNTPYAYYWLGIEDSAKYWTEELLKGNDDTIAFMVAADIYCLLGEYDSAKHYIDKYLKIDFDLSTRTNRGMLRHDFNLDSIRTYVDSLCDEYEKEETMKAKTITFKTDSTSVQCYVDDYGARYINWKIGDSDTVRLLLDVGSAFVQITKEIECKLIEDKLLARLDDQDVKSADGSVHKQRMAMLSSFKLGDFSIENIVVTIAEDPYAPLLLGRSVLDNYTIVIKPHDGNVTFIRTKEIR